MNGTQRRIQVSPCWVEAMFNSEKSKPVALAIVDLCLAEGISQSCQVFSQSGSQAVSRKCHKIKKINNYLELFQVVLKALFCLVIPNQYCQDACHEGIVRLVLG